MLQSDHPVSTTILEFLLRIGLTVRAGEVAGATFLPGIQIVRGVLVFQGGRMTYPGDLLHEAGHLAVLMDDERRLAHGDVGNDGGAEMAAIAWSYAASVHLGLNASVVFHSDGYRGASASLIENFTAGRYFGVPLLEWMGMTTTDLYPRMRFWLRPRML